MCGSEIAAQFLVDHDTARERVTRRRNHKNDGAPVAKDRVCDVKRLFKRGQHDACDSGLVEELEIVVLLGSSAVAVGEKELQLSLCCRRLGPARNVDEERVPDVDQDQTDGICSSRGERPGSAIATKPSSVIADSTFRRVGSVTRSGLLSTFETVPIATPARRATS